MSHAPRHWTDPYINIEFKEGGRDFSGCDCGGLALLVLRREKGILPPDFTDYSPEDFKTRGGHARLGSGVEALMRECTVVVERPQPFDLVRYRHGGYPMHIGIWTGFPLQEVLHIEEAGLFARLIPFADHHWRQNFLEFRRHVALVEGVK